MVEKAYAKLNLCLNIVNKRNDGYYNLDMINTPISLCDKLYFKKRKDEKIIIKGDKVENIKLEENLIYKAINEIKTRFNIKSGIEVYVKKNIPIGSGLGGGSADAAATLRALNKMWKLNLSLKELADIGLNIGADIPFCIYNKLARVRGKGENVEIINAKLKGKVVVLFPNVSFITKDMFALIKTCEVKETIINENIKRLNSKENTFVYFNDFERVIEEANDKQYINLITSNKKNILNTYDIVNMQMTGSGAAIFAFYKKRKKIKNCTHNKTNTIIETKIKTSTAF